MFPLIHGIVGQVAVYDADALILFAAMSPEPGAARKQLISDTISELRTTGIWDELDEIWFMAAHTEQAGLLGWKRVKDCLNVNSATFTEDAGFAGNGSSSYLNTQFVPNADGVNYALNNASFGTYSNDSAAQDGTSMGARTSAGNGECLLNPRTATSAIHFRINCASPAAAGSQPTAAGLSAARRVGPNANNVQFWNGGEEKREGAAGHASNSLSTASLYIGALNSGGTPSSFQTRQFAAAFVGAALTDSQQYRLNGIVAGYMAGSVPSYPIGEIDSVSRYSFTLIDRSADFGTGNCQGVAYDGTHYYFIADKTVFKYSRDTGTNIYTLVDSNDLTASLPAGATQINGANYYDGFLWIGVNNFNTEPKRGWIIKVDPSDLSLDNTYEVENHWCEGGAWRNDPVNGDEFWAVYHDWDMVTRYRFVAGTWTKIDNHLMPLIEGDAAILNERGLYQGAAWHGDVFMAQTHAINDDTASHFHEWDGSQFIGRQIVPALDENVGQGIHWEVPGSIMLFAERDPGGNGQTIIRATFTDGGP